MKNIIVYYQNKTKPDAKYLDDISKTHVKVFEGVINDDDDQEDVFSAFNHYDTNPLSSSNTSNKVCFLDNGEAVTGEQFQEGMITGKVSCGHTSMSVGDAVSIDGTVYLCLDFGWKKLTNEKEAA